MVQVIMKPEIFKYATCKEVAEGFALGAEDLVLTNKFIFEPYFGPLGLKVHTIFQEEYGMGEPTDGRVRPPRRQHRGRRQEGHRPQISSDTRRGPSGALPVSPYIILKRRQESWMLFPLP